jgi:hypothetical protein
MDTFKWIIFFTFLINGEIHNENMTITQDSVQLFDFEWVVVPNKGTFLEGGYGDVVNKAKLEMYTVIGNDTIKAYLHVKYEAVVINIPKLDKVLTANQLPHKPEYYIKK